MQISFATENFLTLNADKCEVVVFKRGCTADSQPCAVGGLTLPTGYAGKCLGFWWQSDLLATRAITENIKKARRAFFAYGGIGAFQGDLSPLSSRSVVETCVMPVLLFGSENWLLNRAMIRLSKVILQREF